MSSLRPLVLLVVTLTGAGLMARGGLAPDGAQGSDKPPGTTYTGQAFTFNKIAEGVYHAVGTGSLVVMSNGR